MGKRRKAGNINPKKQLKNRELLITTENRKSIIY